jgi:hypothetical protein
MSEPLKILSLGAGVQSSTVFLMSCKGILPRLDHAIFADTQWEPPDVYEALEWLQVHAKEAGIPIHVVTAGNLRDHTMQATMRGVKADGELFHSIPLRTLNPDGSNGMIRRQCTRQYKIDPIDKFIRRELLKLEPHQKAPAKAVEKWFGISRDEVSRSRESHNHWETFIYPLIGLPTDMLPQPMTRSGCHAWLEKHYPDFRVGKSACIGCPFRDNAGWRQMKSNPVTWADAVEVDEAIRDSGGDRGQMFLHQTCRPLPEVDIKEDQESLFDDECLGYCGL